MQYIEGCAGVAGTEPHAWETGLMDTITYVGMDVHKATVSVALAEAGRGGEIRQFGVFENRPETLTKLAARLSKGRRRLSFCYEAGPCGYGLHRLLTGCGHDCVVVAPSLIPLKAGDRVKTDRRDAMMLAKLHRAGELTAIWIPDAAHEAMRDLVRARATAVRVLVNARQTRSAHGCRRCARPHPRRSPRSSSGRRGPRAAPRRGRRKPPYDSAAPSAGPGGRQSAPRSAGCSRAPSRTARPCAPRWARR